ncbi:probable enoyl-CoA hydratase echA8 [Drosophila nasuta]|uniref:probable enoyl-CoA hydratase echA8 n=1 Tax=Drosophila nasuta TaxID=42062 RepID=UPI00295F166D|nr:probable enoyl-CoA hydratase echA8 [Drosophila nasuta]
MLRKIGRQLGHQVGQQLRFSAGRMLSTTNQLHKDAAADAKAEPTPPKSILVEKDKNITVIGINRPQQRNAIDSITAAQLCDAFSAFEADDTSPVAVLYGVGGSFCSGFDILEMSTDEKEEISVDILMRPEGSVGPTRRQIKKPVVCGINGYCIANGLELALMCDLRVMEESAVLGFFNRRFGVPMLDGGTVRLPAMIGLSRALDLILTGRPVGSQEAHDIGLVNRIVPTGTALGNALELASCLAKFPQRALNHDRNSVYSAAFETSTFHQAVQNEVMYTSREIIEDMQNGIKWFNQTFKADTTHSWLKRDRSMADWDDEEVAEAAAEKETKKQQEEAAAVEAEKQKQAEKAQKKSKKTEKVEEKAAVKEGEQTSEKPKSEEDPKK